MQSRWRVLKQASLLSSSSGASVLMSFAAFLLVARGLGPARLGQLATAQAYALVVHKIVGFQSWEMTIRYGTPHLGKDPDRLRDCLKLGFLSDGAASLASAALGCVGVTLIAHWQAWGSETTRLAYVLCASNAMNLGGTPTAILRMYDRFGTLALQNLAASVTRLLACATALFFGCSVLGFGIASLCGDIASNLFLLVASCLRLRAEGVARIWSANARGHIQRNRSLVQFALSSHLNSTVRVSRELDVMVVAAFSSASAAGVYKAGHKFASFLSVLTDPFYQVLYPELNRIIVAGDLSAFRRTMRFGAVAAGLSAAGALLIGLLVAKPMIAHLLNVQFTDAFGVFAICGIGWVLWGFSTPLTPALLAMGKAPTALAVHAAAAATYLPLLIWLASIVGAIGAATAFVAFNTIWAALMLLVLQAEFSLWSKSRQEASVQLSSATAAAQPGSRGNPLGDSS